MAGTFSQLYIQIVFAVKGRQNLIQKEWSEELYKYIAGIIKGKNQKPIIVNGCLIISTYLLACVPLWQSPIWSGISKVIPRISLMRKNGSGENLPGRRVMVHFPIPIHKSETFTTISLIKRKSIVERHLKMNILSS